MGRMRQGSSDASASSPQPPPLAMRRGKAVAHANSRPSRRGSHAASEEVSRLALLLISTGARSQAHQACVQECRNLSRLPFSGLPAHRVSQPAGQPSYSRTYRHHCSFVKCVPSSIVGVPPQQKEARKSLTRSRGAALPAALLRDATREDSPSSAHRQPPRDQRSQDKQSCQPCARQEDAHACARFLERRGSPKFRRDLWAGDPSTKPTAPYPPSMHFLIQDAAARAMHLHK